MKKFVKVFFYAVAALYPVLVFTFLVVLKLPVNPFLYITFDNFALSEVFGIITGLLIFIYFKHYSLPFLFKRLRFLN